MKVWKNKRRMKKNQNPKKKQGEKGSS